MNGLKPRGLWLPPSSRGHVGRVFRANPETERGAARGHTDSQVEVFAMGDGGGGGVLLEVIRGSRSTGNE